MAYIPTIGLEVHAELNTHTKCFCSCVNDPETFPPNELICPVCMAHPGALPVVNREAVRQVIRVGTAIGGTIADFSEFDRKNYFYPDIPKGYQISQYKYPLVTGGSLAGVAITRIHLEEDTARSEHQSEGTLLNFNRAGVPLMELVTEPVIKSAEEAGVFARELQLLLRTLGASRANLEKGEMRIEANISISEDPAIFGTKVEVKNLNSFRSVERAISYELKRHEAALSRGEKIQQETRGWDESKQVTFHQRVKEGSADYRYFPEPDIPKMKISDIPEWSEASIHTSLPELPWERRARYQKEYEISAQAITYITSSPERSQFFDATSSLLEKNIVRVQLLANYMASDMAGFYNERGGEEFDTAHPESVAVLMNMMCAEKLSSRAGKDILLAILRGETDNPEAYAKEKGLLQVSDTEELMTMVQEILKEHQSVADEYRKGKESVMQFLVGQGMKRSRGSANPEMLRAIFEKTLKEE